MIWGVAVCANPSLAGSSPEPDRRPTPRRAAAPRPRPHRHRKPPAARTGADARRGWRARSLTGAMPQPRFDQRSYEPEANAGPLACQLAGVGVVVACALGWGEQELHGRRKSDPQNVRIAARLRGEATMTLERVANRLCMGAPTRVASRLQRGNQEGRNRGETLFGPPHEKTPTPAGQDVLPLCQQREPTLARVWSTLLR
jgi:hypothetical protein